MLFCEIIHRQEFKCTNGTHPRDSLLIVLEGEFQCRLEENTYFARANDVFVFHRGTPFERKVTAPLECIYVQFDTFPVMLNDGILALPDPIRAQSTVSLLKKAILEGDKAKMNHYINDLFFLHRSSVPCDKPLSRAVSECVCFLNSHYADAITLDDLAQRFYISKQWLILKFKEEVGKTPIEYLRDTRVTQAQGLLKQTDLPIGEIAQKCGFDNIYYFSNTFKKRVGVSPKKYRKELLL